jgi:hypothetical protein
MKEIIPPRSQARRNISSFAVLAATKDGVLKIPAPMTMPTMMATASATDSVGFGAATFSAITSPPTFQFFANSVWHSP